MEGDVRIGLGEDPGVVESVLDACGGGGGEIGEGEVEREGGGGEEGVPAVELNDFVGV